MSANKAYIYALWRELNNNNEPEIIAFNVEYIVLVANIVNTVERVLYISKTSPFCFRYF